MDDHDGRSGEPAADQPKPLTPPPKLAALTVFVRWRPLRWLDKPLAGVLGIEPRLLSSRVKLDQVRFEGTLRERVNFWLWQVQSWRGSLTLSLVAFDVILATTILLAWLGLTPSSRQSDSAAIAAGPGAAAAYSGLLFGFLLTVALFAVQVRASRQDPSALPLAPMISKKHRTFVVLALTAGVAMANLFFAFAGPVFAPEPAIFSAIGILNGPLLAFLTLLAIWYMSRVLADAGAADLDMAMPAIDMAMREQLAVDTRLNKLHEAYDIVRDSWGITHDPYMGTGLSNSADKTESITIARAGVADDVDCIRLHLLGSISHRVGAKLSVSLRIGESLKSAAGFELIFEGESKESEAAAIKRIRALAPSVFIASTPDRKMPAGQVRQFLKRLDAVLKQLARDGRHIELEERLNDLRALRDSWLPMLPANAQPPDPWWMRADQSFAGSLEIEPRALADSAAQSGDASTLDEALGYLAQSALACEHYHQIPLMSRHLDALVYLCYKTLRVEALCVTAGSRLDSLLGSLLLSGRPDLQRGDEIPDDCETEAHWASLKFALSLIKAAIRCDNADYARKFTDRIFDFHEVFGTPTRDHDYEGAVANDFYSRSDYAGLVLLGWSIEVLGHGPAKANKAALIVKEYLVGQLPSVPRLLALWELYRGDSARRAPADGLLGVTEWDIRDWSEEWRSGRPVTRNGPTDVPGLGLRAAMLLTNREHTGKAEDFFAGPPTRHMWAASQDHEAKLEKLVADPRLNLDEGARAARLERAVAMVRDRRRAGDVAYIRYVLQEPISETRWTKYRKDAKRGYTDHQSCVKALRSVGVGAGEAQTSGLATGIELNTPREYLLDDSNSASSLGAHLGESVASREAVGLFATIEDAAQPVGACKTLASLSEDVRLARKALQDQGCNVNVLVLPNENRVTDALFQVPAWQIPDRRGFGGASLGQWEGLLVLKFPYTNANHAMLLDTTKLLTTAHVAGGSQPVIEILAERNDASLNEGYLSAEEAIDSGEELPDTHTIRVRTRMVAPPPLAIADINAALTIDLRQAAGYVLDEKANMYHRPACESIGEGEHERYLHLSPDKRPNACEKCKPDEWDYEAERRRRTRVEPESQGATRIPD